MSDREREMQAALNESKQLSIRAVTVIARVERLAADLDQQVNKLRALIATERKDTGANE